VAPKLEGTGHAFGPLQAKALPRTAMDTHPQLLVPATSASYALHFESLRGHGRGYCFPCDAEGRVALDALTERGRNNYLFARAVVGRDLAYPCIVRA
jgi:hypothetical protein